MPLSESQCDDLSEKTAVHTERQVKGVLQGAIMRELFARMVATGDEAMDPWDAYAGAVTGGLAATISSIWSVAPAESTREEVAGLMHQMVDMLMEEIGTNPGSFTAICAAEWAKTKARARKGKH